MFQVLQKVMKPLVAKANESAAGAVAVLLAAERELGVAGAASFSAVG